MHYLLYTTLLLTPLLVGGVHTETVALTAALLLAARALHDHDAPDRPDLRSVPSLAFTLFALVCLLQALPLPASLYALLAPTGHDLYAGGWQAMFAEPAPATWQTVSLDPGRTLDRGLRWLALALAAGLDLARRTDDWAPTARAVVAAGLAVAAAGTLQSWTGAERVLFFYEPSVALPGYTTFVSDNHAAGFAGLVSLAAFFLAFHAPRRRPLESVLSATAALGAMIWMFEYSSAGTTLAFTLAAGLFLVLFVGTRTAGRLLPVEAIRRGIRIFGLALLTAPLIAGVTLRYGPATLRHAFWQTHLGTWLHERAATRLEMIRANLQATGDYWLTGAGGGATERILPPYIDWSIVPPATIPTIEHEPLEWLLHYGLPAGLMGLALLAGYAWFLYRRYRRHPRLRHAAALALVLYVGVLAQFHFPFFALGISLPAVVLLESLAAPTGDPRADEPDLRRGFLSLDATNRRPRLAAATIAALVFTAGHFTWKVDLHPTAADTPPDDARAEYARLLQLVPADGDLYIRAAFATPPDQPDAAIRRAEHALEREPKANMTAFAAHVYHEADREERALATYHRLYDGSFADVPTRWIPRFLLEDFPEPTKLARILRDAGPREWDTATTGLRENYGPNTAAQFGLALHDHRPDAFRPHEIVVDHYLQADRPLLAETWVRELTADPADSPTHRTDRLELLVDVLRQRDKPDRARHTLVDAFRDSPPDAPELAKILVELRPDDPTTASDASATAMTNARRLVCRDTTASTRLACRRTRAWLHEHRDQLTDARSLYHTLYETTRDPTPYAAFLARHDQCQKLDQFVDDWYLEADDEQPYADRIADLQRRCRRD